jgi:hypothetical protein
VQACLPDTREASGVLMHELGHNLGLHHGGPNFDTANHKPNYASVMNYNFTNGVDVTCDGFGDGVLDYSHGRNAPLDENALDERLGICMDVAKDWDQDTVIDSQLVAWDINFDGSRGVLRDHDDWAQLIYDFSPAAAAFVVPDTVVDCGLISER